MGAISEEGFGEGGARDGRVGQRTVRWFGDAQFMPNGVGGAEKSDLPCSIAGDARNNKRARKSASIVRRVERAR